MLSQVFEFLVVIVSTAGTSLSLSTLGLVDLSNNGVADFLEVLEVFFKLVLFSFVVGVNPVLGLLERVSDSLLVILFKFISQLLLILNLVAHLVDIIVELMLGVKLLLDSLILFGEFFGFFNHAVNFFLGKATLVVGNSNGLSLTGSLLVGRYSQDAILIDLKGDFNLGSATGCGRNAVKVKLTEVVVVLDKSALSFEN